MRTLAEEDRIRQLRRSRPLIKEAAEHLSRSETTLPTRLESVVLLQDALKDPQHPEAEFLAREVEEIITRNDLTAALPQKLRRELAADKGELALVYLSLYPDRLSALTASTQGTPNQRVIENAQGVARHHREESLRLIQELAKAEGGVSN